MRTLIAPTLAFALAACSPDVLTTPDAATADAAEVGADASPEASADVAPVDVIVDAAACDANLSSDPENCGACGRRCRFDGAASTCVAGVCALGACAQGYANCDGNAANGCETDTTTSAANCGACGRAVDVMADPANCGACGRACPQPLNATATCVMGACGRSACARGFDDCDGRADNGCEASITNDPANCGACGRRCSGAAMRCVDNACAN